MEARAQPEQMKKILANSYTHGEITNLVALEKEKGIGYILNWVRNGTTPTLETEAAALAAPVWTLALASTNFPTLLPEKLQLDGLLLNEARRRAIISGVSFAAGDDKPVRLRSQTLEVRCREINGTNVVLEVVGQPELVVLKNRKREIHAMSHITANGKKN